MRYILILLSLFLISVLVNGKIHQFTKPNQHLEDDSAEIEKNLEKLKKYYEEKCEKFSLDYKLSEEQKNVIKERIKIFDLEDAEYFNKQLDKLYSGEKLDFNGIFTDKITNFWTLTWILIIFSTFTLTIVASIFLLCLKRERKPQPNWVKTLIAFVLILSAFFVLYFGSFAVGSGVNNIYSTNKNTGCSLLGLSIQVLENGINGNGEVGWSGFVKINAKIGGLIKFFSTDISTEPFNKIRDLEAKLTNLTTLATSVTNSITSFEAYEKKQLENPNPEKKSTPLDSTFLKEVKTISDKLKESVKDPNEDLKSLRAVITSVKGLYDQRANIQKDLETSQKMLNKFNKDFSHSSVELHENIDIDEGEFSDLRFWYGGLYLWILVCLICGIVGFFVITLTKYQIFGNLLHCSWICGSLLLLITALTSLALFTFGAFSDNFVCKPSENYFNGNSSGLQNVIDNLKKNKKIEDLAYLTVQSCIIQGNGNLKNQLNLANIQQQATELDSDIKKILAIQTYKLDDLKNYITKIQPLPDKPDQASGTTDPTDQANSLSSWADCSKSTNNQIVKGGSSCLYSRDNYVFDKTKCPAGYSQLSGTDFKQNFGNQTCIVLSRTSDSSLGSKRYLTTDQNQCQTNMTPYATIQLQLQNRYTALYNYIQSVVKIFGDLSTLSNTLKNDAQSLSDQLMADQTIVKSAQSPAETGLITPISDLISNTQCGWTKKYFAASRDLFCYDLQNTLYFHYSDIAYTAISQFIFLIVIIIAAYLLFSKSRNIKTYQNDQTNIQLNESRKNYQSQNSIPDLSKSNQDIEQLQSQQQQLQRQTFQQANDSRPQPQLKKDDDDGFFQ